MTIPTLLSEAVKKYPCENIQARKDLSKNLGYEVIDSCGCQNCQVIETFHSLLRELDGEVEKMKAVPLALISMTSEDRGIINGYNSALSEVQDKIKNYLK